MDVNFCESGSPASNRNFIANVQLMVRGQFWWAVLWKYHGNVWPNKRCVGGKRKQRHNDNNSDLYSQQTWEHFAATREKLVHLSSGTPADLQKMKTKSTAIKWPPKTIAYTHHKSLFSATPAKEHTLLQNLGNRCPVLQRSVPATTFVSTHPIHRPSFPQLTHVTLHLQRGPLAISNRRRTVCRHV